MPARALTTATFSRTATPSLASAKGTVKLSVDNLDENFGFDANPATKGGNWVVLQHDDGAVSGYFHLRKGKNQVTETQMIATGKQVGESGNSGSSSEPHLHFGYVTLHSTGRGVISPVAFSNLKTTSGQDVTVVPDSGCTGADLVGGGAFDRNKQRFGRLQRPDHVDVRRRRRPRQFTNQHDRQPGMREPPPQLPDLRPPRIGVAAGIDQQDVRRGLTDQPLGNIHRVGAVPQPGMVPGLCDHRYHRGPVSTCATTTIVRTTGAAGPPSSARDRQERRERFMCPLYGRARQEPAKAPLRRDERLS